MQHSWGEKRNVQRVFLENPEGKRPLGNKQTQIGGLNTYKYQCNLNEHGSETLGSIKYRKFLDQLTNNQPFQQEAAVWSQFFISQTVLSKQPYINSFSLQVLPAKITELKGQYYSSATWMSMRCRNTQVERTELCSGSLILCMLMAL